jgi:flagellar biosynthetic protein FlhB
MSEGEEQDQSSKTEEPSQKKLDEAVEKGQVVNSKEVTTFIMLLLMTITAIWVIPYTMSIIGGKLRFFVEYSGKLPLDQGSLSILLIDIMKKTLLYISPIFFVTIISAFASSYIQHGEFIFYIRTNSTKIIKNIYRKGFF